jgi:glycosyltransferase involved in cell wall biosynthesis
VNLSKTDYKRSSHPRFLQITSFYQKYLFDFYKKDSTLASRPADQQVQKVLEDGFSAIHNFTPYITKLGYESKFIIANNKPAQFKWLEENQRNLTLIDNWMLDITRKQIEAYRPDILFLSDAFVFDSKFIRQLSFKPKLVIGWTGEPVPAGLDWSEFDIILSNFSNSRQKAKEYGAKATENFYPGFVEWINRGFEARLPFYDVVFVGQWSALHQKRNQIIHVLAKAASHNKGFRLGLYLLGEKQKMPPEVQAFCCGERFGLAMHQALRSGKIAINAGILPEAGNMRLFETTGTGVFLLTEYQHNITDYFLPGEEIETFKDNQELIDKIHYYLEHPEKREAIAERGQERCLRDHSMEKRIIELDKIIRKHLGSKPLSQLPERNPACDIKQHAENLLENDKNLEAFKLIIKAKSLKIPMYGLDYLRAMCFVRMNNFGNALEALREELRLFPSNREAALLFDNLSNLVACPDPAFDDSEFNDVLKVVKPFTLLSARRLYSLFNLAKLVCESDMPGHFVECGVAAGGSAALLAYIIKSRSLQPRKMYAFDTFEGMPAPTSADTHRGMPAEQTGWGSGTCYAPESSVLEICKKLNVLDIVEPVKGYFQNTLPIMRNRIETVAVLHMDGDWYDSTKTILFNLYDNVITNGYIQVDDYGHWDGCKKALKEFETSRDLRFKINPIDGTGVWFRKPTS